MPNIEPSKNWRIEWHHSHSASEEHHEQAEFLGEAHLQADENDEGYSQDDDVGGYGDGRCCNDEGHNVDRGRGLDILVPHRLDRRDLEDADEEESNHFADIYGVDDVNGPSYSFVVATDPQQEQQDG